MIRLTGTAKRSFLFPSDIDTAMHFYADMGGLFKYLPHITLIKTYSKTQFRVLYSSTELSIYRIQLYCDLDVSFDRENTLIKVQTLHGKKMITPKAGMHSSRGIAEFVSTSEFKPEEDRTRVYYHLTLSGSLPKPKAFSLVPNSITDNIAENIAKRRIFEIADGFIVGSLAEFRTKK